MAKHVILWIIVIALVLGVINNFSTDSSPQSIPYSQFVQQVDNDQVSRVTIDGFVIRGEREDGSNFQSVRPAAEDPHLIGELLQHKVVIEGRAPQEQSIWVRLLITCFPILLLLAICFFFMRQMQGGAGGKGGPMSFGKSKAKLLSQDQVKTTFKDVAGCDEAKEEVEEVVDFLKDPAKFQRLGGKIPRGLLMVGPPGTGKTLLAKAIAGEAHVPFFSISGSDFVEMFVGVGASRVRDMFEQAKKQAPCIIFIDEIDAVGRSRGSGMGGGGHDEREQTLNQLLVEMDGFEANDGTIVIAATNRPDVLDPALLRPGRFDRQVTVGLPDIRGRTAILNVHLRKVPLADDVRPELIARGTPGFSGAELANVVNEAALFAARRNLRVVGMKELEEAKDKIMMGAERRSMVMSEKEKSNTAYHEAGHAIIGLIVPDHDPVYKVTIIPRGRALGVTMFLPNEDRYSYSRQQLISQLCSLFGGRIAEEMTLGPNGVTTGASNDIKRATEIAHSMVAKWGLSSEMGPLMYDEDESHQFLGAPGGGGSKFSSGETSTKLDREVRKIIDECYETAKRILHENRDKLDLMAQALIQYETIDTEQIKEIMKGRFPSPPKGDSGPGSSSGGTTINVNDSGNAASNNGDDTNPKGSDGANGSQPGNPLEGPSS